MWFSALKVNMGAEDKARLSLVISLFQFFRMGPVGTKSKPPRNWPWVTLVGRSLVVPRPVSLSNPFDGSQQ